MAQSRTQTLVTSIDPNMVFGEGSMDLMVHEVTSDRPSNLSSHGQMPFLEQLGTTLAKRPESCV